MGSKILVAGVLAVGMAFAQWGPRREDPSGGMLPQWQSQFDQFAEKLKLNKEQRADAGKIIDAGREAMGPLQQKLIEARRNLAAALIVGQSGDAIDKLTQTYTSFSAQATAVEAKAFGKICALLKPSQQSRAVENFGLMAQLVEQGRMSGPWSAGQPGGDRSRQGGHR